MWRPTRLYCLFANHFTNLIGEKIETSICKSALIHFGLDWFHPMKPTYCLESNDAFLQSEYMQTCLIGNNIPFIQPGLRVPIKIRFHSMKSTCCFQNQLRHFPDMNACKQVLQELPQPNHDSIQPLKGKVLQHYDFCRKRASRLVSYKETDLLPIDLLSYSLVQVSFIQTYCFGSN